MPAVAVVVVSATVIPPVAVVVVLAIVVPHAAVVVVSAVAVSPVAVLTPTVKVLPSQLLCCLSTQGSENAQK
jgi:hypothetical protein